MSIEPIWEPLAGYRSYAPTEMAERAIAFYVELRRRRTVREFDGKPVPREVVETCLLAAGTAPSGANLQPWHFAVIQNAAAKKRIRVAAEAEERAFYSGRAPKEWLEALAPLGTDAEKPFLEEAPLLIGAGGRPRRAAGGAGERATATDRSMAEERGLDPPSSAADTAFGVLHAREHAR